MNAGVLKTESAPQAPALQSFESHWRALSLRESGEFARSGESWSSQRLRAAREEAMRRFLQLGLPTSRDESWRYTNLRSLAAQDYALGAAPALGAGEIRSWLDPAGRLPTLLIVNGYFVADVDAKSSGPLLTSIKDLKIRRLRDLSQVEWESAARRFPAFSDGERHRWALLNTALFSDGLHVEISGQIATPLLVLYATTEAGPNTAVHPRLMIEAAPGSRATIIEHHLDGAGGADAQARTTLCNSVTRVALGTRAELEHYRVFSTGPAAMHFDTLDVRQGEASRCRQFTVVQGGALVRATLEAHLEARGSSLDSYALLVGHESRHVDCVNLAAHAAPDTQSRQTARAIASGDSRVIFNSTVRVDAGARNADSQQSCRGLLLSAQAEIDSRPQLEIHTDEVKCSHGATTGRLDPDMLFYLLSRGLDRETAQSLLVFAFLADVLTSMQLPEARAAIENALITQLPDSQLLRSFR